MVKPLLLFAFALSLFTGVASASPGSLPLAGPALAGVEAAQAPATQECAAQDWLAQIEKVPLPICAGNGCDKTADCRPAGLPECANCWCVGPAGDKSCACF